MREYAIGEVAEILGVKQHVLRYWEQEIPLVNPEKDGFGRRVYSGRDLQILLRVRYLVQEAGYTVRGASERILAELTGSGAGAKARLQAVRDQLLPLLADVSRAAGNDTLFVPPEEWADQEELFRDLHKASARARNGVLSALDKIGRESYEQLRAHLLEYLASEGTGEEAAKAVEASGKLETKRGAIPLRVRPPTGCRAAKAIEAELYSGGQCVFTPELRLSEYKAFENAAEERRTLGRWAELIREAEYEYGRPVHWFLPVHITRSSHVERLFSARNNFGLAEDRVHFLSYADIPVLSEDGKLVASENEHTPACFYDPQTAGMLMLGDGSLRELVVRYAVGRVWLYSLLSPPTALFDIDLAALQRSEGAELCIEAQRLDAGRYTPTGRMILLPTLLHKPGRPLPLTARLDSPVHSAQAPTDTHTRTARLGIRVIDLYYWSENSVVAAQGG